MGNVEEAAAPRLQRSQFEPDVETETVTETRLYGLSTSATSITTHRYKCTMVRS